MKEKIKLLIVVILLWIGIVLIVPNAVVLLLGNTKGLYWMVAGLVFVGAAATVSHLMIKE